MLRARNLSLNFLAEGFHGSTFGNGAPRFFRDPATGRVMVRALQDVSLITKRGDRIGLIGPNGAGKSTLLRTLCGIFRPSSGEVMSKGRMGVILQPSVGADMHASGRQNIWLIGLLNGMTRSEIVVAIPDILDFCGLGDFLDMPLKTYSAGMRMRLIYAIVTASSPEIVLMDEVIGVGDKAFVAKAAARRMSFMKNPAVLILASHQRRLIQRFCNRVIWLEGGRILDDSRDVTATLARYDDHNESG